MPWIRLDDHFPDHRKVAELGDYAPVAGWLFICGLAYCNRQLTDGFIPKSHVVRLSSFRHLGIETGGVKGMISCGEDIDADHLAELLADVGLWEDHGTHWYIHDYSDYQPTRAEVEAERAAKQAAGRAGGQASAQARAVRRAQSGAPSQADAQADAQAGATAGATAGAQAKSKPVPDPSASKEAEVAAAAENSTYLGVRIPPGLRDRVIEHCMALGERNLDAETVQAVIQCHEDLPAADIDWARRELRRAVPRRAAWPSNVREVIAQRDGSSARTPTKPADGYREPPPPHIDDVLEAIKNRPHREPRDPGEDALLADMKANNPAAYEAEMDLRRRAHERAMST